MAPVIRQGLWILLALLSRTALASPVWYTDGARLGRVDLANGTATAIQPIGEIRQLAAGADGSAWVLTDHEVLSVSSAGGVRFRSALASFGYDPSRASISADPYDGSVWLLVESNLVLHMSAQGQVIQTLTLPLSGEAIAIGLDQSLWIATPHELLHYSRIRESLPAVALSAAGTGPAKGLFIDSIGGRAWVEGASSIAVVDLLTANSQPRSESPDDSILAAALDPGTGFLWILTDKTLIAYDKQLSRQASIPLDGIGASGSTALAYDVTSGKLVVVTPTGLTVVSTATPEPTPVAEIVIPAVRLATPPFAPRPRLSLDSPLPGAPSIGASQGIALDYAAGCPDTPCRVAPSYFADLTLEAALNGRSIAWLFAYDPTRNTASSTRPVPWSPGRNVLEAQLTDRFGRTSDPLTAQFNTATATSANAGHAPSSTSGAASSAVQTAAPTLTATQPSALAQTNQPPTVSLTAPTNGQTFTAGSNITLSATASDVDDTISKVAFYRGGTTLIGTATAAPYSITWSSVPAGSYSLTAVATDSRGASTTSAAVSISVVTNQPPVVTLTAPTQGSVLAAGSSVSVTATASDPDDAVSKVDFYAGSTLIGTSTTAPYGVTWTNVAAGSYSLTAVATDSKGAATTSAAIAVSVVAPPLVVVTSPASCSKISTPANLTLKADAVSPSSSITKVDFYQGSTLLGTSTSAPYSYAWNNVPQGTYSITAKGTDANGFATVSRPVSVTVAPPDVPPTVSITSPTSGSTYSGIGTVIPITATAADGDGTVTQVAFYVGGTLVGTSTAAPYGVNWTPSATGTYSLTAVATDNGGLSTTSAAVSVTVTDSPASVSITSPSSGAQFMSPATIAVSASASDSDGTVTRVDFYADGALIGTATASPYTVTWTTSVVGTHSLTAKATDNAGLATTSSAVSISVVADAPPSVSITSPTSGSTYTGLGTAISVTATAADSDGTVTQVAFYVGGTLIGTSTAAPYTVSWKPSAAGAYSLTAVATDNAGLSTTSAAVSVTIADAPPTVNITLPASGATYGVGATIPITASASDSDGTITQVAFSVGGTVIGTTTSSPYSVNWAPTGAGTYSLTAIATDSASQTTTSAAVSVTIVTDSPPSVGVTEPLAGSTFSAGSSIRLAASASSSSSSISRVDFYANGTAVGSATSTPYIATWSNVPAGSYQLTAVATDSLGVRQTSSAVSISVIGPTLTISAPQSGATVTATSVLVSGSITAPPNSGVNINGVAAELDDNNNFYLTVPLVSGSNSLMVQLVTSDGYTTSQTLTVTSGGTPPFIEVIPSSLEGISPLTVNFTVFNHSKTSANVQLNGNAAVVIGPGATGTFAESLTGAGSTTAVFTATDGSGNSANVSLPIVSHDPAAWDLKMSNIFSTLNNALTAGDKTSALAMLSASAQTIYSRVFDELKPYYASIAASFSPLQRGLVTDTICEYAVNRTIGGVNQIFLVYFIRGPDGIWRLESM